LDGKAELCAVARVAASAGSNKRKSLREYFMLIS
jgi:hypothetical protein